MSTPSKYEPRVLRLRSIELLAPGAVTTPDAMLQAKRHGIDAWVHEIVWHEDAKRPQLISSALRTSRADFPFALCIRLTGASAVATHQRVNDVLTALREPTYLTKGGRPLLFVRDEQGAGDLVGFAHPIRQAARAEGLREPILVRVARAADLEGKSHVPGFDEVLVVSGDCSCGQRATSPGDPLRSTWHRCLVASTPADHRRAVQSAIEGLIDDAIRANLTQVQLYVHACDAWTDQLLDAHDSGVLRAMELMPSFPSVGAPYSTTALAAATEQRPALSVVMVAESNAEATMVCLQSALDTSSELGDLQFVVVDNGSTDDTQALIAALGDNVTSLRNNERSSTKEAWRQAMSLATGELILMISNDVVLGLGWHEPLVRALTTDPSCNAVSPAIAIGTNQMPTQPPSINSGVCLLARGNAARADLVGDARFVDESVVFLRIETRERAS